MPTGYPQTYSQPPDSVCVIRAHPLDAVSGAINLASLAVLRLFCSKAAKTVLTPAGDAIGYLYREGALAGLARRRPVNGIGYRQSPFRRNGGLQIRVLRFTGFQEWSERRSSHGSCGCSTFDRRGSCLIGRRTEYSVCLTAVTFFRISRCLAVRLSRRCRMWVSRGIRSGGM